MHVLTLKKNLFFVNKTTNKFFCHYQSTNIAKYHMASMIRAFTFECHQTNACSQMLMGIGGAITNLPICEGCILDKH
jgi:hypothetical protein